MSASLKVITQKPLGTLLRALLLCVFLLPFTLAQAAPYDGVWTGTSIADTAECGSDTIYDVVVHIEDSWLTGSASFAGEIGTIIYGQVGGDGTIIYGEAYEDEGLASTFTGNFAGEAAELHWTNTGNACTGTVTLNRDASYDSGFAELWYGEAYTEEGPYDCGDATFIIALDLGGTILRGTAVGDYGEVFRLAGELSDTNSDTIPDHLNGQIFVGTTPGGLFEGTFSPDEDTVTGTWSTGSGDNLCSGTFWQSRLIEDTDESGWGTPLLTDAGWIPDSSHGEDALRADYIGDGQNSKMSYTADFYDGTIRFSVMLASESDWDCLRLYLDDIVLSLPTMQTCNGGPGWSGETSWIPVEIPVTAGLHTLVWSYEKDASVSVGDDTAWAHNFEFPVEDSASLEQLGYIVPPEADAGWLDEGSGVFRSADITDGQWAQIEYSGVFAGDSVIAFEYYVSSEAGWDYLRFYIDGEQMGEWSDDVAWNSVVYPVTAGQHTFTWSYEKDGSISEGEDLARIRAITYPTELQSLSPALIARGFILPDTADMGWREVYGSLDIGDSPGVGQYATARMSYTGEFVAGYVGFWYSVSSEADFDSLEFYIDGVNQFDDFSQSGEIPWTWITFPITAGEHTLTWSYEKDYTKTEGGDAAWISQVSLPLTFGATPFHQGVNTPGEADAGWEEIYYTDAVDHSQKAQTSFSGDFSGLDVSFDLAVSSEAGFDFLRFYIDGNLVDAWSGEWGWTSVSFPITAGEHTLLWSYEKDGSLDGGNDVAWLRRIALPLDLGGYGIPGAADAGWQPDTTQGADAFRSEPITHDQVAQIHRTEEFAEGAVQFDLKVSSEAGYDFLVFYVNGVETGRWSGEVDWTTVTFSVPAAPTGETVRLLWSYEKDGSVNSGADAAWIRNVQLPPVSGASDDSGVTDDTGSNAGWTETPADSGVWQSDPILGNQRAGLIRNATEFATGAIRFAFKVSSEASYDCMHFLIDGTAQSGQGTQICSNGLPGWSGEVDWTLVEFPVTAGIHTLLWSYEKDGSVSQGEDRAYIRQIDLPFPGATEGDTRAPTSSASPTGGSFNSPQQVTLSCDDAGGSGCGNIYYTTDGNNPVVGVSPVYTGPISISSTTTLKFQAEDNATPVANLEAVRTEVYAIDNTAPLVSITAPADDATLSDLDVITGTASDPGGSLDRVMVQVSKPGTTGTLYLNSSGTFVSAPTSIRATGAASWSLDTAGVTWSLGTIHSINVTAIDSQGNSTTTSRQFGIGLGGLQLETQFKQAVGGAIGVRLSSDSVTPNGSLTVSGILHLGGNVNGLSRAGQPITLTLTKPDLVTTIPFNTTTTNEQGAFTFNNVTGFDVAGVYKLEVAFAGNAILQPTSFETQVVVGQAGYAIIVQGKISSNSGLPAHKKTTDRIYDTLIARGFLKSNIRYFAYSSDLPADQFETPGSGLAKAAVQSAIQTWAKEKLLAAAGPLYVVFVNHGFIDTFHMNDEVITPADLDGWLDNLETVGLAGESAAATAARAEKRIIILGSCFSGSFIPALQGGLNRLVITSAAADEQSFKGATEADGIPVGEYFLQELFTALGQGSNLREAFRVATDLTEIFTFQGGLDPNSSDNPFQDSAIQHPLLDDNGDGIGSNVITTGGADGETAQNVLLGVGPVFVNYAVQFTGVTPTLYLNPGIFTATLHATLDVPNWTAPVPMVAIRSPNITLTQGSGTEQQTITELVEKDMSFNGTTGRWEVTYTNTLPDTGFDTDGKYDIIYLIRDANGRLSPIQRSVVYRRKDGNGPPAAFNLLTPADQAEVNTVVVLDWEDAPDSDGPVTYNLLVSSGPGFEAQKIVVRREGIVGSSTFVTGLTDNTQYFWKVEAVDPYGERRTSTQTRSFRTREPNSAPGIIQGVVLSDLGAARLIGALISNSLNANTQTTDSEGRFIILAQAGAVTLTTTLAGYESSSQPLTVRAGEATQVTIQMAEQVVDSDGDGIGDDTDNCPATANATQLNTDGDTQGDACDLDDDNDGDADTADNCPLVSNADQLNTDGDSQGNACDSDDDNDTVPDSSDAFPLDSAETLDTDRDGTGNNADTDDDGDGMSDTAETAAGRNPLVNEAAVIMIILQGE